MQKKVAGRLMLALSRRRPALPEVRPNRVELLPLFPVLTSPRSTFGADGAMRKLLFGIALTMPIAFMSPAATALPGGHAMIDGSLVKADLIEVKGGHGRGHGWGRGHGYRPFGWSRGRKVGWRGRGCPPGHWKKGWC
jgi:hypothetical protein